MDPTLASRCSATAGYRGRRPDRNTMSRSSKRGPFTDLLIQQFPDWLAYFEANCPFRRYGQLEYHRQTLARRSEFDDVVAAIADEQFCDSLYRTLQAWGIGSRASKLRPFAEFCAVIRQQSQLLARLDAVAVDDPGLDVPDVGERLWRLIEQLPVVDNLATLVPVTKALHHLLPDLVVPIDREYTQTFFGWENPQFQYGQRVCFSRAFAEFAEIARTVRPAQYIGSGWNSCRTKVIDNAIVGLIQYAKAQVRAGAG